MAIRKSVEREDKPLSPHFRLSEFRCHGSECAGLLPEYIDPRLVAFLERIRTELGEPIAINSGFRCPTHNARVEGAAQSQHMHGRAADIEVRNVAPPRVYKVVREIVSTRGWFKQYPSFVHLDCRYSPSSG